MVSADATGGAPMSTEREKTLVCCDCGLRFKPATDPEKRSPRCPACIALMALKYGVKL